MMYSIEKHIISAFVYSGVISITDIEPFTHESILKNKRYRKVKSKTDQFVISSALAYV